MGVYEIKINDQVKDDLKALSDPKYREFHGSLCPGTNNILGVRVPVLRKYAKDFIKENPNVSYKQIDDEFYEEVLLKGMLIGLISKNDFEANLKELEYFIPKIDNWAVCDIFVAGLKFIKRKPQNYWDFTKSYVKSSKEFEKRFAYVTLLDYYITDEYIDEVLKMLVSEQSQEYYVYMAVAWALSVCLIKYYEKTVNAMKSSNLNKITYNKAIQKACESYRIDNAKKEVLRKLKK